MPPKLSRKRPKRSKRSKSPKRTSKKTTRNRPSKRPKRASKKPKRKRKSKNPKRTSKKTKRKSAPKRPSKKAKTNSKRAKSSSKKPKTKSKSASKKPKTKKAASEGKVEFVLKVGLEDPEELIVNKKNTTGKVANGLKSKRSKLWKIISRTYSHVKDILKEESIGGNKIRITAVIKGEDPVEHIKDLYGDAAADTWQSGNIILEGNLEVTLDLVSVKLVK